MTRHIVVAGNPVEGFEFHGPFKTINAAITWAEQELSGDWWIAELKKGE